MLNFKKFKSSYAHGFYSWPGRHLAKFRCDNLNQRRYGGLI